MLTSLSQSIASWARFAGWILGLSDGQTKRPLLAAAPKLPVISDTSAAALRTAPRGRLRLVASQGELVPGTDTPAVTLATGVDSPARPLPIGNALVSFLAGEGARLYSLEAFRNGKDPHTPHAA